VTVADAEMVFLCFVCAVALAIRDCILLGG